MRCAYEWTVTYRNVAAVECVHCKKTEEAMATFSRGGFPVARLRVLNRRTCNGPTPGGGARTAVTWVSEGDDREEAHAPVR